MKGCDQRKNKYKLLLQGLILINLTMRTDTALLLGILYLAKGNNF